MMALHGTLVCDSEIGALTKLGCSFQWCVLVMCLIKL